MPSMLLLLALQAAAPAADPFAARAWGRIERSAALLRFSTEIAMSTDGYDAVRKRFEHRFRLVSIRPNEEPVILWASSRTCSAVREVAELRALPLPEPQPPGGDVVVVSDGVDYAVTAPFGYGGVEAGKITVRSNVRTPLAAWVDGALAKLERCWSPKEPG